MSENIKTLAALKADVSLTAGENTPSDLRGWLENLYPGEDMTSEFGFAVTINGKGYQIASCNFDDTTEDPSGDGYDSGDGYEIGSIVVNQSLNNGNGKVWLCVDATLGSSVWVDITNQNRYDPDAVHVDGVGEFTDITSGALDLPADGIIIYEDPNNSYEKRTIKISDLFINAGEGMNTSTYDPTGVEADAFDMDNMVEGTNNKIFTAGDDSKLAGIESEADKTDAVNVEAAGAVMNSDTTSDMSIDLVGKIALQPAIRSYVQSVLGTGIDGDIAANDDIEGDTVEEALTNIIADIVKSDDIIALLGGSSLSDTRGGKVLTPGNSIITQLMSLDSAIEGLFDTIANLGGDSGGSITSMGVIYNRMNEQSFSSWNKYLFYGTDSYLPLVKDLSALKLKVTFEAKDSYYATNPTQFYLFGGKLNDAGDDLESASVISDIEISRSATWSTYTLEDNISKFDAGMNVIGLDVKRFGGTTKVRNVQVEITS
jgi:hypothetical protein